VTRPSSITGSHGWPLSWEQNRILAARDVSSQGASLIQTSSALPVVLCTTAAGPVEPGMIFTRLSVRCLQMLEEFLREMRPES